MVEDCDPSENYNDYTENDLYDTEPIIMDEGEHALSFIVQKLLSTPQGNPQRNVFFRIRCTIQGKVCDVIIDSGNTKNIICKALVKVPDLPLNTLILTILVGLGRALIGLGRALR